MQTFLPYSNFDKTAKILDYRRLGKQRIEAKQIFMALQPSYNKKGWRNHPAVKMWKDYEKALLLYGMTICNEWILRGYKDSQYEWFKSHYINSNQKLILPPWIGSRKFHRSHKSNLLRKDKKYYKKYFKNTPDNLPYIWPTING